MPLAQSDPPIKSLKRTLEGYDAIIAQMNYPLISCIMPTANRCAFVEQSLKLFQAQDYPNKELIIVEDGNESVARLVALMRDTHIRCYTCAERQSIGSKRNLASALAIGEFICHWDDDDYYGPQRLSKQVAPLLANEADVSAMKMSLLYSAATHTLYRCAKEAHAALFAQDVRSGTLMYRARYWHQGLRYEDCSRGEDVAFLQDLLDQGARLARIVDPASYVCVRHADNATSDMDYSHKASWHVEATLESYTELLAYMATRKEGENDTTTQTRKEPGNITQLDRC